MRLAAPHDLLLLDLDGTISDPLTGIFRSLNYALAHFGHELIEMSECSIHIGPPLDEAFKAITGVTEASHIDALIAKYRERYADVRYTENVLYPGMAEALAALGAAGTRLAVCTSKRQDFAVRILEMFGLRKHFAFVDGGDTGMPKLRQIERLLAHRAVSSATVMVGDRAVDLIAAHRNGLPSAGVLWGHGSREELVSESPRYLFNSPSELLTLA